MLQPTSTFKTILLTSLLSTSIINRTDTDEGSGAFNNGSTIESGNSSTASLPVNSTELVITASPTSLYVSTVIVPTSVQTTSETAQTDFQPTSVSTPLMTSEMVSSTQQMEFSSFISSDRITSTFSANVSTAGSNSNSISITPTASSSQSVSRTVITDSSHYTSTTTSSAVPTTTPTASSTSNSVTTPQPKKLKGKAGGLSTGGKVAIGIIVPIIIIAVLVAGILYYRRHYRSGQWGMSNSVAYRPWRHSDEESLRFNR